MMNEKTYTRTLPPRYMYVVAHVSDPDASYKVDLALGLQVL